MGNKNIPLPPTSQFGKICTNTNKNDLLSFREITGKVLYIKPDADACVSDETIIIRKNSPNN